MEQPAKKKRQAITDRLYSKEELDEIRAGLVQDFKDKGLNLEDYAKATGLLKASLETLFIKERAPRPISLMAIDKYLKSLKK